MKEKIGIEKLIELLKDQYGEVVTYNIQSDGGYMFHICGFAVREERLLSKKFGFIKWLVENDKIDFEKKLNTIRFESLVDQTLDSYLALLMLLAISNSPIEDLLLYLK